jgi:hypothetical protein
MAGCSLVRSIHKQATSATLSLLDSEHAYLSTLNTIIGRQGNPETSGSLSVFVSKASLDHLLEGVDGTQLTLDSKPGTTVKLNQLRTLFKDGFPEIVGDVTLTTPSLNGSLNARLAAVIEPRIDKAAPSTLLLYIRPLDLQPTVTTAGGKTIGSDLVNGILGDLAKAYSDLLPHLTVPLSQRFSIAFPPSKIPVSLPTQHGKLNGEVDAPGLTAGSSIIVSGLVFLSDGIHIYLTAGNADKPDLVFPYQIAENHTSYSDQNALDAAITVKEKENEDFRQSMTTKLAPMKVQGSDVRVWVSQKMLALVTDTFNKLTPQERTFHYHTLSEEGQIYQTGGGGAGCGGYANVSGGNTANADLAVNALTASFTNTGATVSADFQFSFNAQVVTHVNGPAGPHTFMVLNCIDLGLIRPCTNLPSVTISCDTPIGGGVSGGSYGINGNRTDRLAAAVSLHSDASTWLAYDVAITSPDQIPITISVGLGQLGSAGFPITVPVPHQSLLTGKAPNVLDQTGTVAIPSLKISKPYKFSLSGITGSVDPTGYAAAGKLAIQWN